MKNNLTEEIIDEIKEKYSELKSTRKVSELLGVSRDSVRKYAKIIYRTKLDDSKLKANKVKSVVDWRARTKEKLVDYKGGKCIECGYNKCLAAMDFHHLDPTQKDFSISGKSWSFERLKKEVDKCILLCNRCHTELHYLK